MLPRCRSFVLRPLGGGLKQLSTRLRRPEHTVPPATWHTEPPPPVAPRHCAATLSPAQVSSFTEDGFLVIPSFYSEAQLTAAREDIEAHIDRIAHRLYRAGKISQTYAHESFTRRFKSISAEFGDASIMFAKDGVLAPSLFGMFSDPRILDVAAQVRRSAVNLSWPFLRTDALSPLLTTARSCDLAHALTMTAWRRP